MARTEPKCFSWHNKYSMCRLKESISLIIIYAPLYYIALYKVKQFFLQGCVSLCPSHQLTHSSLEKDILTSTLHRFTYRLYGTLFDLWGIQTNSYPTNELCFVVIVYIMWPWTYSRCNAYRSHSPQPISTHTHTHTHTDSHLLFTPVLLPSH